jgi:hypothetical protein
MNWVKKGLIYQTTGHYEWNKSHAQLPIVDVVNESRWRIYFASRDTENRSRIGFIEVEANRPENLLYEHDQPILPLGKLGAFDESGMMPVGIANSGDKKYLYYAGWSLKKTVPYHNSIGLAVIGNQGESFEKYCEGPLFDARLNEPYFTGTANVLIENGVWKMWYQSCTKWEIVQGQPEPFYHLKYAESPDGINWSRNGTIAIDYRDRFEGGISSAAVLKENGIYQMWYSSRGAAAYRENKVGSYRIGYAESADGVKWQRKDDCAGIDVSASGWDSEMIAYPFVLRSQNKKYMFYNGNGFGRSGFGYAVSE